MPTSDILIGQLKIFYSAVGAALPAVDLPADAAWPVGWSQIAMTTDPLKMKYDFETVGYDIQESLMDVERRKSKEEVTFTTGLAEFTGANLSIPWDGQLTTHAATASTPGYEELTIGDINRPVVRQWGFEGNYEDVGGNVFPVRLYVWRANSAAGGETEFGKAATTKVPLEIKALADMSKPKGQRAFKIVRITSVPTAPPAALALSSSNPADEVTGVAVGTNPTLTYNNTLASDAVEKVALIDTSNYSVVPATVTLNETAKIITITPDDDLNEATEYLIVANGVEDIYGQTLSSTVNFTTESGT